jgi:Tyrosine-protein kinase ephrin type A/B receptor-like
VFTAEGSRLDKQKNTIFGGGGRMYITIKNLKVEDIYPLLSVSGYISNDQTLISNAGTMAIQDSASVNTLIINNF